MGCIFEPPHEKNHAKTKAQISVAVTAILISAFVFATRIVQFLDFLNPEFSASLSIFCDFTARFVLDLIGYHINLLVFHEAAHIMLDVCVFVMLYRGSYHMKFI